MKRFLKTWLGRSLLCAVLVIGTAVARADNRYLVTQTRPSDCGPAALATLLRFYLNVPAGEDEMARLAGTDARSGTTLLGLEAAAKKKNCAAGSFRMDYATLQQQLATFPTPVIARTLNPEPHFSLVLDAGPDYVALADPARGNILMRTDAFLKRWLIAGNAPGAGREGYIFVASSPRSATVSERRVQIVRQLTRQLHILQTAQPQRPLFSR
jgi:predicted double-glycine peptidase